MASTPGRMYKSLNKYHLFINNSQKMYSPYQTPRPYIVTCLLFMYEYVSPVRKYGV